MQELHQFKDMSGRADGCARQGELRDLQVGVCIADQFSGVLVILVLAEPQLHPEKTAIEFNGPL